MNRALDIFMKNIDEVNAFENITKLVKSEGQNKSYVKFSKMEKSEYPSLSEDDKDDEEIMRLMEEATVNNNMKDEAANALFQRQSVRQF